VVTILSEALIVAEVECTPQSKMKEDLGADSLDFIEVVVLLEESFGIIINDNDAEDISTVQQLVDSESRSRYSSPRVERQDCPRCLRVIRHQAELAKSSRTATTKEGSK